MLNDLCNARYLVLENHPNDSRVKIRWDGVFQTLSSRCGTGGGNVPMVLGVGIKEGIVGTLDACYFKGPGMRGGIERTMVSQTNEVKDMESNYWKDTQDVCDTLTASNADGSQRMPDKDHYNGVIQGRVRRLTPVECERLMGFEDNYTNIPEGVADSKRYKAIGNGMAQPCADWVISQIVAAESNIEEKEE